ncbi:hypothetical protein AGMMS49579_01170 [Spirochaetia bacterium]|nr:hypothetical protein AGMMS49579_01170 [Spirochaetia bacterium]
MTERIGGYQEGIDRTIRRNILEQINQSLLTDEEKFIINLSLAFDQISNYYQINLGLKRDITNFAEKMPFMAFKNPTTYILGCLATLNRTNHLLNKHQLQKVIDVSLNFKSTVNVNPEDVIRYARFAIANDFYSE